MSASLRNIGLRASDACGATPQRGVEEKEEIADGSIIWSYVRRQVRREVCVFEHPGSVTEMLRFLSNNLNKELGACRARVFGLEIKACLIHALQRSTKTAGGICCMTIFSTTSDTLSAAQLDVRAC